jgi:hypothetical protein
MYKKTQKQKHFSIEYDNFYVLDTTVEDELELEETVEGADAISEGPIHYIYMRINMDTNNCNTIISMCHTYIPR